jgi:GNAT superfamily N-acetyltransferase
MKVRALERSDVRAGFSCGEPSLDTFLERYAWQDQARHHLGVTYVAVDDHTRRVVGYFTLAGASISPDAADERIAAGGLSEVPVVRIGRLAVDSRVQHIGVGSELLHAALRICLEQAGRVGCVGALVDALPESVAFYERFGFRSLSVLVGRAAVRPRPVPMFLSIGRIRAALADGELPSPPVGDAS